MNSTAPAALARAMEADPAPASADKLDRLRMECALLRDTEAIYGELRERCPVGA